MHTHMHTHTCTHTHAHTHAYTHMHTHAYTHMHMHTHTCTHTHAHICTHTCIHTQHTCTHTYRLPSPQLTSSLPSPYTSFTDQTSHPNMHGHCLHMDTQHTPHPQWMKTTVHTICVFILDINEPVFQTATTKGKLSTNWKGLRYLTQLVNQNRLARVNVSYDAKREGVKLLSRIIKLVAL